jgi:4-hydroxy-tetrahydrodipicolinate synthase
MKNMPSRNIFGLSCALATPFLPDGGIDTPRLVQHARNCLREGCSSITVFGTTGEGSSLGLAERSKVIAALQEAGVASRAIVGGVMSASQDDAADQTRILMGADCKAVLLAPPFYFKGVSDDGLFAWFSGLFDKLGTQARDIILYNIPSVTAVSLSVSLIGRLRAAFPGVVTGVKDSSGDWPYTQGLLAAHSDLVILIGDERHLAHGVRLGAQGAISGLANVIAPRLLGLVQQDKEDPAVVQLVNDVVKYPVIPAVKALVAAKTGDDNWLRMRSPLVDLPPADAAALAGIYSSVFAEKAA